MRQILLSVLALIVLAACGGPSEDFSDPTAIEGGGPDASDLVLNDPLVTPPSKTLPQPTPGGTNLADPG